MTKWAQFWATFQADTETRDPPRSARGISLLSLPPFLPPSNPVCALHPALGLTLLATTGRPTGRRRRPTPGFKVFVRPFSGDSSTTGTPTAHPLSSLPSVREPSTDPNPTLLFVFGSDLTWIVSPKLPGVDAYTHALYWACSCYKVYSEYILPFLLPGLH